MRAFLAILLCANLSFLQAPAHAQQRLYHQAELDALLAPIALYPDGLLSQVLMAATYPEEVAQAAKWSRDNPGLTGQDAVRAVEAQDWDASVKALVAFPDVLARMDESPQWTRDLGQAFLQQEPHVMDTVQALRQRARTAGNLQSNEHYSVAQEGEAIVVQPVQPHVVYVHHYDPYVVYGPWWWPAYRPVFWRPWAPRPVYVTSGFFYAAPHWHYRHVRVIHRPAYVHRTHTHVVPGRWQHRPSARAYVRVPEANRRPIINSAPQVRREPAQQFRGGQRAPAEMRQRAVQQQPRGELRMPAPSGFSPAPRVQQHVAPRIEQRREAGRETRREMRREAPRQGRQANQRGNGRG
jgi:hypothetical protein